MRLGGWRERAHISCISWAAEWDIMRISSGAARRRIFCAVAAAGLAWPAVAMAAVRDYIGPNGGNWNVAGSWTGGAIPVNGDDVTLGHTAAGTFDLTVNFNGGYGPP